MNPLDGSLKLDTVQTTQMSLISAKRLQKSRLLPIRDCAAIARVYRTQALFFLSLQPKQRCALIRAILEMGLGFQGATSKSRRVTVCGM